MKVCPRCYSLLWHRDYSAERRAHHEKMKEETKLRLEMLRKTKAEMKARAREGSHVRMGRPPSRPPNASTMTLRSVRKRLIALIWGRAMWWRRI